MIAPQCRPPAAPLRAPADENQCRSFFPRDLGKLLGRGADLDSLLDSFEALLKGELVEEPFSSASRLHRLHTLFACRAVRVGERICYIHKHEAKLQLFAERAGDACGIARARRLIHSALRTQLFRPCLSSSHREILRHDLRGRRGSAIGNSLKFDPVEQAVCGMPTGVLGAGCEMARSPIETAFHHR